MRGGVFVVPLLLFSLFAFTSQANAHPHVFVDARITLQFDEEGLEGFQQEWAFDEMFGEFILEDYDSNKNHNFEKKETAKVKAEAFDNLKQWSYFQKIDIDGKAFKNIAVENFLVKFEGGKVVYSFFIPCKIKIDKQFKAIDFSLSDPTIYTDLCFTSDSPKNDKSAAPFLIEHKLDDGVQPSGQVLAQTLKMKIKRK